MADWDETGSAPRGEEKIGVVPSVKGHAERVRLQHTTDVVEGAEDALGMIVVGDGAIEPIAIPNAIRRVSDNEID
jgi:hypothetical protein